MIYPLAVYVFKQHDFLYLAEIYALFFVTGNLFFVNLYSLFGQLLQQIFVIPVLRLFFSNEFSAFRQKFSLYCGIKRLDVPCVRLVLIVDCRIDNSADEIRNKF